MFFLSFLFPTTFSLPTHSHSLTANIFTRYLLLISWTMPPSVSSSSDLESIISTNSDLGHESGKCPLCPPSPINIKPRQHPRCQGLFQNLSMGAVMAVVQAFFHLTASQPCNVGQTMVANGSTTVHVIYPTVLHFSD